MSRHPADWFWVNDSDVAEFFRTMGEMRSEHSHGPYVDSCYLWRFDRLLGRMHRGVFVAPFKAYKSWHEYGDVLRYANMYDVPIVCLDNATWLGSEELAEADLIISTKGLS